MKYRVSLDTVVSFSVEVEADSDESAIDMAYELAPDEVWGADYEQSLGLELNNAWQLNDPQVKALDDAVS